MEDSGEIPLAGVSLLEHTADIGLEVEAPDLPTLFRRAALGMTFLLLETLPDCDDEAREISVASEGLEALLREWLREILRLHEVEGFAPSDLHVGAVSEEGVEAVVRGTVDPSDPVREIKGVTLHELAVERSGDGWLGRVIFDV